MNVVKENRSKKMFRDFLIYSIGVIGSKLMTFLLLPLYTYYISDPAEYGYYDLCLTACFLLMPIVTLQLRDGAFRFLLDTKEELDRTRIVTFVNKTLVQTSVISVLVAIALHWVYPIKYLEYNVAFLIALSFYDVYAQTVRGLGNNRSFIAMSLIASLGIAVFSIIFLVFMDLGVVGILLANTLSRILALVAVEMKEKALKRYFNPRFCDYKEMGRELLKFSFPLLPAGICWWFIGFSNRYFITNYLSLHDSGIYGVASRLAIVVQTISTIFMQTWQENAIQQYNSEDRNTFFSKVFNSYIFSFVLVILLYTFAAKIFFPLMFNANYNESLQYLYPLCIATMFFALSGYFEVIYQCEKCTRRLVPSLIAAPVLNVVLNYVLIQPMGVYGVIVSYAVTYIMLIAYRWIDMKKFVTITVYRTSYIPLAMLILGAVPFIVKTNYIIDILLIVVSISCLFISKDFRTTILSRLTSKLHKS